MTDMELANSNENDSSTRIITAAIDLFMEYGFKGTTTKMIAEAAKVNEATLFRHFKSKDGIFVEISKEITRYNQDRLQKLLEREVSPEEMLYQFGIEMYKHIVESKGILIISITESKRRSELVSGVTQIFRDVIDILEARLTALYHAGVLKESDFFIASIMYVETLIGAFIVQNRMDGELIPIEIERLCRSASRIMIHGLLNDNHR